MAVLLGVNKCTLRAYTKRNKIVFSNKDITKCYFCSQTDNSLDGRHTKRRRMQPLIEMIKKFAIQEKKSELKIICKIAVQLLYHSNRKICLIFQKIGEDPQEFVTKFKSIVTMMKYSKKSSDKDDSQIDDPDLGSQNFISNTDSEQEDDPEEIMDEGNQEEASDEKNHA